MKTTKKSTYVRVMVRITKWSEDKERINHVLDFVTIGFENVNKLDAVMRATLFCQDLRNVNFVLNNMYEDALEVEPVKISKITIKEEKLF